MHIAISGSIGSGKTTLTAMLARHYGWTPRYGPVVENPYPEEFFVGDAMLPKWQYEKGAKKITRTAPEGHEYIYSEGGMAFPDYTDRPSRTIITGEGGAAPSRFKHIVQTASGRYRRLLPLELERLNMLPDNHTAACGVSDGRRAFLMGNALVCGVVREIGRSLSRHILGKAAAPQRQATRRHEAQLMLDFAAHENAAAPTVAYGR